MSLLQGIIACPAAAVLHQTKFHYLTIWVISSNDGTVMAHLRAMTSPRSPNLGSSFESRSEGMIP